MVLHHLHVLERCACPVGQCHAVTGADIGVGSKREHASASAGADDNCFSHYHTYAAATQFDCYYAINRTVVDQEARSETLVITGDGRVLERGLEQRMQHMEAGLVCGKPRAHLLHAAERAHGNASVGLATPRASPMLKS